MQLLGYPLQMVFLLIYAILCAVIVAPMTRDGE